MNLIPLGPGFPKSLLCAAIQRISPPPAHKPLPSRALGAVARLQRCCWVRPSVDALEFAAPNHPRGRKVLLGQSLEIPEFLKLLFSLQHMLRTHHTPEEAANKSVLWLLSGFGRERSQKSSAPSPPGAPWHWRESSPGLCGVPRGTNGLSPTSPNTGGFACSFLRGRFNLRLFMI